MPRALHGRDDLLLRKSEPWRPPIFRPRDTAWSRFVAVARRTLDLQTASIWRDLKPLLADCRGTLLDVGCGAQPYRELVPAAARYQGIDTADALAKFGYRVRDTLYFDGDTWPIETGAIDTVLATETLEHVPRPNLFLAEARRVLTDDGWLILTVPFAARWHYIPHDYWRFTPSGLAVVLNEAGFDTLVVHARGNEITVACYKCMALVLVLLLGEIRPAFVRFLARVAGAILLPILLALAAVAHLSLASRGGNDCLGYTAIARPRRGSNDRAAGLSRGTA